MLRIYYEDKCLLSPIFLRIKLIFPLIILPFTIKNNTIFNLIINYLNYLINKKSVLYLLSFKLDYFLSPTHAESYQNLLP